MQSSWPRRRFAPRLLRLAGAAAIVGTVGFARSLTPYPGSPLFSAWQALSARFAPSFPVAAPAVLLVFATALLLPPLVRRGAVVDATAVARFAAWLTVAAPAASALRAPSTIGSNGLFVELVWLALIALLCLVRLPRSYGLALVATASLLLAATVILDAEGLGRAHLRRPGGLLCNRNFAGEYLALALAPCGAWLAHRRARPGLILVGAALVLTRCRTAWIVAAVAGGIWLLVAQRRRRAAVGVAIGLVAVGVLAGAFMPTRLRWAADRPYVATLSGLIDLHDGSGALRVRQYNSTVAALYSSGQLLLGFGPGRWREVMSSIDPTIATNWIPHSDYLRALSDGGLVGLAGLLLLHGSLVLAAWRARNRHPWWLPLAIGIVLTGVADIAMSRPETLAFAALLLSWTLRRQTGDCSIRPVYAVQNGSRPTAPSPPASRVHESPA